MIQTVILSVGLGLLSSTNFFEIKGVALMMCKWFAVLSLQNLNFDLICNLVSASRSREPSKVSVNAGEALTYLVGTTYVHIQCNCGTL